MVWGAVIVNDPLHEAFGLAVDEVADCVGWHPSVGLAFAHLMNAVAPFGIGHGLELRLWFGLCCFECFDFGLLLGEGLLEFGELLVDVVVHLNYSAFVASNVDAGLAFTVLLVACAVDVVKGRALTFDDGVGVFSVA